MKRPRGANREPRAHARKPSHLRPRVGPVVTILCRPDVDIFALVDDVIVDGG